MHQQTISVFNTLDTTSRILIMQTLTPTISFILYIYNKARKPNKLT
jgi:hypothetical protein